jgi:hypothetical protein
MTDEELEKLRVELSREIERLCRIPDKQLSRTERKRRVVLRARKEALEKIKKAREDGSLHGEARASLDYSLLTRYGEKNVFLYNFMKARMCWWPGI